jgi:ATPase subunit of ABC transporter with duplicated ATPase domains
MSLTRAYMSATPFWAAALKDVEGTMSFVSHDGMFLGGLGYRRWIFGRERDGLGAAGVYGIACGELIV